MALADHGIKVSVIPTDGWHYMQLWSGGLQRIPPEGEAPDDAALVRQVTLFRVNQAMELGDVEADVADYIKSISPASIWSQDSRRHPDVVAGYRPLLRRIQEWLVKLLPIRPRLVREGIARERGMICLGCPQQVKWQTKCVDCNGAVEYNGRVLRQKAAFDLDKELTGGCRLHDFLCSAAIFLSLEALPKRSLEAPANCWLE